MEEHKGGNGMGRIYIRPVPIAEKMRWQGEVREWEAKLGAGRAAAARRKRSDS